MRLKISYVDGSFYIGEVVTHTTKQVQWGRDWVLVPAVLLKTDSGGFYLLELQQWEKHVEIKHGH